MSKPATLSPRVLIVESDPGLALDLKKRLSAMGYEVAGMAATGNDALAELKNSRCDLILMGSSVAGMMRGSSSFEQDLEVPIVFLTNGSEDTTWRRATVAHAFGYAHQPLDDRELETVIEMTLYKYGAEEEIHRLNRLYATLSQINQAVVRFHTRQEVLQEVCRVAVEVGGFTMAGIGWLEKTRMINPIATYGVPPGALDGIRVCADDPPESAGPTAIAVREGRWVVENDLLEISEAASWHALALQLELRSMGAFPIRFRGEICGALSIASKKRDFFKEEEIHLLQEAVTDISFALDKLEEEAERKRVGEQLREGEERYRRLVDLSPDTVLTHCEGRIVFINPAGLKLFGATHAGQLLDMPILELVHPDFRDIESKRIKMVEGSSATVALLEEKILRLDGASLDVEVTAAGFTHFNKPAVQVMLRDITARKMMEARFLRDQRIETIGALASGIAHDLNNVLAPIVMTVALLRDKCEDEDTLALISAMETSAHRGAGIIQQLLTFGRGATGQRTLIQPKHLLSEIAEIARETFPKSIQVRLIVKSRDWLVSGDATQLHQVILNLCVNARDAMPAGGEMTLSIEAFEADERWASTNAGAKAGPYIIFSVKDSGKGVPKDIRDKIFEPFFTTKAVGKGTGLGLATCLNLVKKHGGFINLASEPGQGAEFKVFLPATAARTSVDQVSKKGKQPMGNGEVVLLVDDEENIRTITRTALQMSGYKVLTASDGAQAVAVFQEYKDQVQLVFMDVMMPIMGGPAAMRLIRALSPTLPMIATSGMIPRELENELAELKPQGFLAKPFTTDQLLGIINSVLAEAKAAK